MGVGPSTANPPAQEREHGPCQQPPRHCPHHGMSPPCKPRSLSLQTTQPLAPGTQCPKTDLAPCPPGASGPTGDGRAGLLSPGLASRLCGWWGRKLDLGRYAVVPVCVTHTRPPFVLWGEDPQHSSGQDWVPGPKRRWGSWGVGRSRGWGSLVSLVRAIKTYECSGGAGTAPAHLPQPSVPLFSG